MNTALRLITPPIHHTSRRQLDCSPTCIARYPQSDTYPKVASVPAPIPQQSSSRSHPTNTTTQSARTAPRKRPHDSAVRTLQETFTTSPVIALRRDATPVKLHPPQKIATPRDYPNVPAQEANLAGQYSATARERGDESSTIPRHRSASLRGGIVARVGIEMIQTSLKLEARAAVRGSRPQRHGVP
ncbi:hypothetical protein EJ06DRAFT_518333 [Trichodelitschia bisporula]|uniref:Uncharacterized protein n=1 Tax=Trichodelitschia bisporula TaxID=703511 RepID=A0A6G1IB95_9PEZI|nr:hypothetical protein EJ06DRAFT_518333 [Trichodelitschia bisporula]